MRFSLMLVSLMVLAAHSVAPAQSPLEELERRLDQGAAPRMPGYLGLTADDRNTGGRGLRVVAVRPDSPAEAAGVRVGDLLQEIERRPLRTTDDMSAVLATRGAGESIAIAFERDGERHLVTARLAPRPAPQPVEDLPPLSTPQKSPSSDARELPPPATVPDVLSPQEEWEALRRESADLRRRLEQLERRLKELETRLSAPQP